MASPSSNSSEGISQNTVAAVTLVSALASSFGHPLSSVLSVKLDEKNYLLWRGMVLAILKGQKVHGYVLGTMIKPPEFLEEISSGSGITKVPNPRFEEWCTVDQALMGWLFGSMTPTVAADVIEFESSHAVWKALAEFYGATSKARVNQLRSVLQNTK